MILPFPRIFAAVALATVAIAPMKAVAETPDGTIVIAGGVDVTQINPLFTTLPVPDGAMLFHVFDSVVILDPDGVMQPWLAESFTLIDDLTWEFTLRPGITFSNGEPVVAEGIKLMIDTVKDPATRSPSSNYAPIDSVEVIDDLTFRIHTNQPIPVPITLFSRLSPLPVQYFAEVGLEGYLANPIGTGAYTIAERVRDTRLVLEARDDYWGGPQRWDRIIYRPIPEAASRVSALLAGEIDLAIDVSPELAPMLESGRGGVMLKESLTGRTYMLLFNTRTEGMVTQSRDVREAIAYGIDRNALVDDILEGHGAPAIWGARGFFGANPDNDVLPYDPDHVRELLAAAGYPDGIDITLATTSGTYLKDREIAEAMAGQLTAAGIRTTVQIIENAVMMQTLFGHTTPEVTLFPFGVPWLDTDAVSRNVVASTGAFAQATDPVLDEIIARQLREMDPTVRAGILLEQQARENEFFPLTYVAQINAIVGVSEKLADWTLYGERFYFFQNDQLDFTMPAAQ